MIAITNPSPHEHPPFSDLTVLKSRGTMIYTGDVITELTAAPERTSMFDTGEQLLYYGKINPTKPVAGYDLL